jgi:hypothetical protein
VATAEGVNQEPVRRRRRRSSKRRSLGLGDTLKRFPLPIVFATLGTAIYLAMVNGIAPEGYAFWPALLYGLGTAAIFALAGDLYGESHEGSFLVVLYRFVAPALIILLFLLRDDTWIAPQALPIVGALWISMAHSGRRSWGDNSREQENRWWWFNYELISTAGVAAVALFLVFAGAAIFSLATQTLLEVNADVILYRIGLPILAGLVAPFYWFSTIPRLREYDERRLLHPDFLARAAGTIGKFVMIPLLLAYGLVLLLYTAQIIFTQALPQGILGWMVLGFVVAGAATWLMLFPWLYRERGIVRFFRHTWFWLSILPIGLYAVAVYVRVDTYGFTPERLLLVWGGIWAVLLTLAFLAGQGDIRLIPGIALFLLLIAAIGPWNLQNFPRFQQSLALEALLTPPEDRPAGTRPDWTIAEKDRARGAITYLANDTIGRSELARVLRAHGYEFDAATVDPVRVMTALSVPPELFQAINTYPLSRDMAVPVDVEATPLFVADVYFHTTGSLLPALDLSFRLEGTVLKIGRRGSPIAEVDLLPIVDNNDGRVLARNAIDFAIEGVPYRLVVDTASITPLPGTGNEVAIDYLDGALFRAKRLDTEASPE